MQRRQAPEFLSVEVKPRMLPMEGALLGTKSLPSSQDGSAYRHLIPAIASAEPEGVFLAIRASSLNCNEAAKMLAAKIRCNSSGQVD